MLSDYFHSLFIPLFPTHLQLAAHNTGSNRQLPQMVKFIHSSVAEALSTAGEVDAAPTSEQSMNFF